MKFAHKFEPVTLRGLPCQVCVRLGCGAIRTEKNHKTLCVAALREAHTKQEIIDRETGEITLR